MTQYAAEKGGIDGEAARFAPSWHAGARWGTAIEATMRRKLVWIEEPQFGGFGCSECGWRFKLSEEPTGTSLEAMMEKLALQRDKEFTSHVCADSSKKVEE